MARLNLEATEAFEMSTENSSSGQHEPTSVSVSSADTFVVPTTPQLNRAQRRALVADLNREAALIRKRLGFVPEPAELEDVIGTLVSKGFLTADEAEFAHEIMAAASHEDGRCVAWGEIVKAIAPRMALAQNETLSRLFGDDARIEMSTISPVAKGRQSIGGKLAAVRYQIEQFAANHIGFEGIYLGRDVRSSTLRATAVASAGDIAESRFWALDFDWPTDWTGTWQDWVAQCDKFVSALKPTKPVAIVWSGGGLHVWWRINPSIDSSEIKRRAALAGSVAKAIGADPSPCIVPGVMRHWPGINAPKEHKRLRGQRLAVVRAIHEDWGAPVHDPDALAARIHQAMGGVQSCGSGAPQAGTPKCTAPMSARGGPALREAIGTAAPDFAPPVELAILVFKTLPNPETGGAGLPWVDDRKKWVAVAYALKSATKDAPEARASWLEWCTGDPDENARVWDTAQLEAAKVGWRNLCAWAKRYAPNEYAMISNLVARADFARADPVDPADIPPPERVDTRPRAHDAAREALRDAGLSPFRTPEGKLYGALGHENFNLAAVAGRRAIAGALIQRGVRISKNARSELMDELEAEASIGPVRPVHVRAAFDEGSNRLWIDLADGTGRAAIVDGNAGTWRVDVIPLDGPRFHRPNGSAPLPVPVSASSGTLSAHIRALLNLPAIARPHDPNDPGVQADAAILLALASWAVRSGTAALLFIGGPQGAGKTSAARLLTAIIDPVAGDVARPPADARDLFVVARSRLAVVIDNLSDLDGEFADALAALLSGADLPRRALYSDDDVVSLRARSGVVITSVVADIIHRADLGDRMLRLDLGPVATRRTEGELRAEFATRHPAMLGALLTAIAAGIRDRQTITDEWGGKRLIRLIDAAVIAEGAARSMGWPRNLLIDAVERSRSSAVDDLLAADPVAQGIEQLLDEQPVPAWSGTARDLLGVMGFATGRRDGPKTERGLAAALDRLREPLRERGIVFERSRSTGRDRTRRLVLRREGGTP